ncbi:MAG: flagellar filament outer layer protein FlaA [Treponema sp.]|jgi:hypothetical protein|nr:flagellar filament outer layer protein FlaA [Treponema sp.]
MKRISVIAVLLLSSAVVFAQQGGTDPNQLGIDSAQQEIKEVSVDKFEQEGYWRPSVSADDGIITSQLFEGNPAGKVAIPEEEGLEIPDLYVLGTRIDFLHRGHTSFTLKPAHPIPIEGITKTLSMWVAGRNYNHKLVILIQDFFGRNFELTMGNLNFQGWKKLTVAVPPQGPDGKTGIVQRNYHYNNQLGIKVTGFRIDCDPAETTGTYYVYFDDLRAVTDLFSENSRDPDDMADAW